MKYPWQSYSNPDLRRQFKMYSVLGSAALPFEKLQKVRWNLWKSRSNVGGIIIKYENLSSDNTQVTIHHNMIDAWILWK